ncbi:MAG: cytochrome c oxidase subunit II [Alphaproteobacteria bacterium]|nr:cytochrome c oxidase subunit II [Alphaproteobacteria bacterium]
MKLPSFDTAVRSLVLTVLGATGLAGCELWPYNNGQYPYTTTDPISDFGMYTHELYAQITWIVLVIFAAVTALLAFTLLRFRDDGQPGNPEQIHGNTQMEIGWTLLPIVIVLFLIVPTVRTIFVIADAPPAGAIDPASGLVMRDDAGEPVKKTVEIKVIGKRWWWAFEYVNEGIVTGNQFAIPDDRPVSLLITSDTVIHSFWVPRIGGKRDAVPGRMNRIWFNLQQDVQPGEVEHIRGECAEYCGDAHALMRFEVIALDGADFDRWVTEYQAGPKLAGDVKTKGEAAFAAGGCIGCHAITGNDQANGLQGPNLTFFGDRRWLAAGVHDMYPNGRSDATHAHDLLTQWVRHPDSLKPGTTKHDEESRALDGMNIPVDRSNDGILQEDEMSTEQLDAIVAYLLAQTSSYPIQ